eukprot:SAG31_NODE_2122_length_6404_cov_4.297383_5_plen_232_part_00
MLVAMQAMHNAANQIVLLASDDMLVDLLKERIMHRASVATNEEMAKLRRLGPTQLRDRAIEVGVLPLPDSAHESKAEGADSLVERIAAAETPPPTEDEIKQLANNQATNLMTLISTVIAFGDFLVGPLLGAAADAFGRKALVMVAPLVQGFFRAAIARKPTISLFVAFQMAQGVTNIAYGRVLQLMIGDIVPRHTMEYQRVGGLTSKVNTIVGLLYMLLYMLLFMLLLNHR